MNDEIRPITCTPGPTEMGSYYMVHHGNVEADDHDCKKEGCEAYSYEEWLQSLKDISGVNEELMGTND